LSGIVVAKVGNGNFNAFAIGESMKVEIRNGGEPDIQQHKENNL